MPPKNKGRRSAVRRAREPRFAGAARALRSARSPSGAPPRHSPGTSPSSAPVRRFLRPGVSGVTRFRLSQSTAHRGDRSYCLSVRGPEPPGSGLRDRARAPRLPRIFRSHPECALRRAGCLFATETLRRVNDAIESLRARLASHGKHAAFCCCVDKRQTRLDRPHLDQPHTLIV